MFLHRQPLLPARLAAAGLRSTAGTFESGGRMRFRKALQPRENRLHSLRIRRERFAWQDPAVRTNPQGTRA